MTTDLTGYFDYAATAPMVPEAIEAYAAAAGLHGNPSSLHGAGTVARQALDAARKRICDLLGFDDGRLLLTSGGTESNNLVLRGFCASKPQGRILVAADVHPSQWFATTTWRDRVDVLPLPAEGGMNARWVAEHITTDHVLVCLSHACNETGRVHDVRAIAGLCGVREIACQVDGTQALGHLPVDLGAIPCDYYTFSAHKFGGPRGIGGLFIRDGELAPQQAGGNQEWELRAGTENVAGLIAAAEALAVSCARVDDEATRLRGLARELAAQVQQAHSDVLVNSDLDIGLPGLVSLTVPGLASHEAAVELDLRGFAVSTGSACHADQVEPSRVILALGRDAETALGTLRISMGYATTDTDVAKLARELIDVIAAQRVG